MSIIVIVLCACVDLLPIDCDWMKNERCDIIIYIYIYILCMRGDSFSEAAKLRGGSSTRRARILKDKLLHKVT